MSQQKGKEMLRQLINAVTSGFIDIGEIIKWRAEVAATEKEKLELETLGYRVENGVAKATILETNQVPKEAIYTYALEHDFKVYDLHAIDENYAGFIIPPEHEKELLDFIDEYIKNPPELEAEEEYGIERQLNGYEEPDQDVEKEKDENEEAEELEEIIEDEEEEKEEKEDEKSNLRKKDARKKKSPSKSSDGSYYNYSNSINNSQSEYTSYSDNTLHVANSNSDTNTNSILPNKSNEPQKSTIYSDTQRAGVRSGGMVTTYTKEQQGDTRSYTISSVTSHTPNLSADRMAEAMGRVIVDPVLSETRNNETGKELQKIRPMWNTLGAAHSVLNASYIKDDFVNDVQNMFKKGELDHLDKFLNKQGIGFDFTSKQSLEESFDKIFGGQGKRGFFGDTKINFSSMSEEQITKILVEHFKLSDEEAAKVAQQGKKAYEKRSKIGISKNRAFTSSKKATKAILRQSFKDDEGMQTVLSGFDVVYSTYRLLQVSKQFPDVPPLISKETIAKMSKDMANAITMIGDKTVSVTGWAYKQLPKPIKETIEKPVFGTKKVFNSGLDKGKRIVSKGKKAFYSAKSSIDKKYRRFTNAVDRGKKIFTSKKNKALVNFKNSKTGRFVGKGVKVVKSSGRWVVKSTKTVKRISYKFIGNPVKFVFRPYKITYHYLRRRISGIIETAVKFIKFLLKKVYIFFGVLFAIQIFLACAIIIIAVASSVIVGFFEYDDGGFKETSIMTIVYKNLCEQERDWLDDLAGNGQFDNLFSYSHSVNVNNQTYTIEELDLEDYCNQSSDLEYYDGGVKGPKPFNGYVPLDAYKAIKKIDGGNEVFFTNGYQALVRTSNIKDIISMSTVFYSQDFSRLNRSNSFVAKLIRGVGKIIDTLNNVYKNFKKRMTKWTEHIPFLKGQEIVTVVDGVEIMYQSTIVKIYCTTLFQASHGTSFELEKEILPIIAGKPQEQETSAWIDRCTKSDSKGCKKYTSFYYLDDGGGLSTQKDGEYVGSNVYPLGDDCSLLSTDAEKAASPCWREEISYESVTPPTITGGTTSEPQQPSIYNGMSSGSTTPTQKATVTYVHECVGNHSGKYCGGHLKLNTTGIVYTMTDAQINGTCVGKVPESNKIAQASVTTIDEAKLLQLKLNKLADIFDIDSCIHHITTQKHWNGWTKSNMEWACNLYNQDWYELYNLKISDRVEGGFNGGFYTEAEIKAIMEQLDIDYANLPLQNAAVLAEAYKWIGIVGYDQCNHRDELVAGGESDCSGYVSHVLDNVGINVGILSSAEYYSKTTQNLSSNMIPGDIIAKNGHVMIFAGVENGEIVALECTSFGGKHGPGITKVRRSTLASLMVSGYRHLPLANLY